MLISLGFFGMLMGFSSKENVPSSEKNNNPKVKVTEIKNNPEELKLKVEYKLNPEKPILVLLSPQINSIQLDSLKKEIGHDHIGLNKKDGQITIDLKEHINKKGIGEFELLAKPKSELELAFHDIENNELALSEFNLQHEEEQNLDEVSGISDGPTDNSENTMEQQSDQINDGDDDNPINDDETQTQSGWIPSTKLRISTGFGNKTSSSTEEIPILYFGNLFDATRQKAVNQSSVSITSPNNAMVVIPPYGSIYGRYGDSKNTNQYYTSTYGDNTIQKSTPENFVTTDIYEDKSGKTKKPVVAGPDAKPWNSPYHGKQNVHLYYKKDPQSGLEEQRLTFEQSKNNSKILIKITQRFIVKQQVEIRTSFTNIGKTGTAPIAGYAFRDLTPNITTKQNNKVFPRNYLRSLGLNQGVYVGDQEYDGRFEVYLDGYSDSPYAWAGRSSVKSDFISGGNKNFPWQPNNASFRPEYNAFSDIDDQGDKHHDPGMDGTWIVSKQDFGITMHTKRKVLMPNESVSMTYKTNYDINVKKHPTISLKRGGDQANPIILDSKTTSYLLEGEWHHYDSKSVQIFYTLDDPNMDNKQLLPGKENGTFTQLPGDQAIGKAHDFSSNIPLGKLEPGVHTIRVVASSENDKNSSEVKTIVLYVTNPAKPVPDIEILAPKEDSSAKNPDKLSNDQINLAGQWLDSDSKKVKITYSLDNQDPQILGDNIINSDLSKPQHWELNDFDISEINDINIHKITFTISDYKADGKTIDHEVSKAYYFQREKNESWEIIAPDGIDFGTNNLPSGKSVTANPTFDGSVQFNDQRSLKSNGENQGLQLTLSVSEFELDEPETDNQNDESAVPLPKSLRSHVSWNDPQSSKMIGTSTFIIPQVLRPDSKVWKKTTDLTELVESSIKLHIHELENTDGGKFTSTWTWSVTDSLN